MTAAWYEPAPPKRLVKSKREVILEEHTGLENNQKLWSTIKNHRALTKEVKLFWINVLHKFELLKVCVYCSNERSYAILDVA